MPPTLARRTTCTFLTTPGYACEDTGSDGCLDVEDNCPDIAAAWFVPVDDSVCDGRNGEGETIMGTDPGVACGVPA